MHDYFTSRVTAGVQARGNRFIYFNAVIVWVTFRIVGCGNDKRYSTIDVSGCYQVIAIASHG